MICGRGLRVHHHWVGNSTHIDNVRLDVLLANHRVFHPHLRDLRHGCIAKLNGYSSLRALLRNLAPGENLSARSYTASTNARRNQRTLANTSIPKHDDRSTLQLGLGCGHAIAY